MRRLRRRLGKLLRLPAGERWLLVKAALLLVAVRVGLWTLPFLVVRRVLAGLSDRPVLLREPRRSTAEGVVWAVEAAGNLVPWSRTCLTQALAAQVLLARRGCHSLLHIGVVRSDGESLEAHAWVESGGEVVIGGFELDRYTPLMALGADSESPVRS